MTTEDRITQSLRAYFYNGCEPSLTSDPRWLGGILEGILFGHAGDATEMRCLDVVSEEAAFTVN